MYNGVIWFHRPKDLRIYVRSSTEDLTTQHCWLSRWEELEHKNGSSYLTLSHSPRLPHGWSQSLPNTTRLYLDVQTSWSTGSGLSIYDFGQVALWLSFLTVTWEDRWLLQGLVWFSDTCIKPAANFSLPLLTHLRGQTCHHSTSLPAKEAREKMQDKPRSSLLPILAQASLQLGSYQLAFADVLYKHLHLSADPICICLCI